MSNGETSRRVKGARGTMPHGGLKFTVRALTFTLKEVETFCRTLSKAVT